MMYADTIRMDRTPIDGLGDCDPSELSETRETREAVTMAHVAAVGANGAMPASATSGDAAPADDTGGPPPEMESGLRPRREAGLELAQRARLEGDPLPPDAVSEGDEVADAQPDGVTRELLLEVAKTCAETLLNHMAPGAGTVARCAYESMQTLDALEDANAVEITFPVGLGGPVGASLTLRLSDELGSGGFPLRVGPAVDGTSGVGTPSITPEHDPAADSPWPASTGTGENERTPEQKTRTVETRGEARSPRRPDVHADHTTVGGKPITVVSATYPVLEWPNLSPEGGAGSEIRVADLALGTVRAAGITPYEGERIAVLLGDLEAGGVFIYYLGCTWLQMFIEFDAETGRIRRACGPPRK